MTHKKHIRHERVFSGRTSFGFEKKNFGMPTGTGILAPVNADKRGDKNKEKAFKGQIMAGYVDNE